MHGVLYAVAEQGCKAGRGCAQALCLILQRGRNVRPQAPELPGLLGRHLSPRQRSLHSAGVCAATGYKTYWCGMHESLTACM